MLNKFILFVLIVMLMPAALTTLTSCVTYDKCKEKYGLRVDTTLIRLDTVIYTDAVRSDTIVRLMPNDTIYINKGKLQIRIEHHHDTLTIRGECKPDTIIVTQYAAAITKNVFEPRGEPPWYEKIWHWVQIQFAWIGLIVLGAILLFFLIKVLTR